MVCALCGESFDEGVRVTAICFGAQFENMLPVSDGPVFCNTDHAVRAFGRMPKIIVTVPT